MPERYRHLFAHFADPLFVEDASGVILDANDAAALMLGVPRVQLIGRNSSDFLSTASLERLSPLIRSLRPEGLIRLEAQFLGHDNAAINVDLTISLIPWTDTDLENHVGKVDSAYLVVAHESGEREGLFRELRVFRNAALENAQGLPHALFYVSSHNSVTRFPRQPESAPSRPLSWVKNLILSPAMKGALDRAWSGVDVVLPPAWYSEHAVAAGSNISGAMAAVAEEARQSDIAGQRQHWLGISLKPVREEKGGVGGILVQAVDLTSARLETERKDVAEDQTVLAMLTSSIHHELNNYLSVIIAQASAMRMALPQGQLPVPNIGAIVDAGQDAVGLLRRSADLLGRIEGALPETDLNAAIADAGHLLRHTLPDGFTLKVDLGLDLPKVRVDARLLRTLILVLAKHLQTRLISGTLTLKTYRPRQVHPSLIQAAFSLEDTGSLPGTPRNAPGVRPGISGHGSEPPGIALARAIARYHRAQLEIQTSVKGTAIELCLPAFDGAAGTPPSSSEGGYSSRAAGDAPLPREQVPLPNDPLDRPAAVAGVRRVLIADDEENFRTFMGWSLQQHGYEVVLAANGQEAFERFQEAPTKIDLVILDAYMPLMGGLETYLRIQVLRPDLPVVFASGFVRGPSVETLIDGCPGPATVLLKPFSSEDLVKAVELALMPLPADDEEEESRPSEEEVAS